MSGLLARDAAALPGRDLPALRQPPTASPSGCGSTLTVNEFTRDALGRAARLDVFGEQGTGSPYVHVADAARAIALVVDAPAARVAGDRVRTSCHSAENYRRARSESS